MGRFRSKYHAVCPECAADLVATVEIESSSLTDNEVVLDTEITALTGCGHAEEWMDHRAETGGQT